MGVLLAKRMGYAFLDTDLLIQSGEGRQLWQIARDLGMAGFCDLEAEYVSQLSCDRTVIATGGSVVYRNVAMDHLLAMGRLIYLDSDLTALTPRLVDLDARGVIRTAGQTLEALYAERTPLYTQYAQIRIACQACTPDRIVQRIVAALENDAQSTSFF